MTPGARIETAIELFRSIELAGMPADVILDRFFRGKRYVGAKDRRSISDRVFGQLRCRARLDWWVARVLGADTASILGERAVRARMIADMALNDGMSEAAITETFSGNRHCPPPLDRDERRLAEALADQPLDHPEMPNWVAFEYPGWLDPLFEEVWGDDLARQLNALNEPAGLDLRVNALKGTRDEAVRALAGEGFQAEPTPYAPMGLRIRRRLRLGSVMAYQDGLVEVQDEGSQMIAMAVDARPGMRVVDYCAGAGGKTLAMAAAMANKGTIVACDVSEKRLSRLDGRLRRAGVRIVTRQLLGPDRVRGDALDILADRVLVDAPCSGTGTWRRSPDSRWRLTPPGLERLLERQRRILEAAARLVRPGGRLIYATCSILRIENTDQITWFLANHPDFEVVSIETVWREVAPEPWPFGGPYLNLTPALSQTDGFFTAVLTRRA